MPYYIARDADKNLISLLSFGEKSASIKLNIKAVKFDKKVDLCWAENKLFIHKEDPVSYASVCDVIAHYLLKADVDPNSSIFSLIEELKNEDHRLTCHLPTIYDAQITCYEDAASYEPAIDSILSMADLELECTKIKAFATDTSALQEKLRHIINVINKSYGQVEFDFLVDNKNYLIDWNYLLAAYELSEQDQDTLDYWLDYINSGDIKKNAMEVNGFHTCFDNIKFLPQVASWPVCYTLIECQPKTVTLCFLSCHEENIYLCTEPSEVTAFFTELGSAKRFAPRRVYQKANERLYVGKYINGRLTSLVSAIDIDNINEANLSDKDIVHLDTQLEALLLDFNLQDKSPTHHNSSSLKPKKHKI